MLRDKDTCEGTARIGAGGYLVVDDMHVVDATESDAVDHEVMYGVACNIDTLRKANSGTVAADAAVAAVDYRVGDIDGIDLVADDEAGCIRIVEAALGDNIDAVETDLASVSHTDDMVVVAGTAAGKLDALE